MLQEANRLHEADKFGEELDLLSKAMEIDQDNATIYLKLGR